jgi:hypothetical protein
MPRITQPSKTSKEYLRKQAFIHNQLRKECGLKVSITWHNAGPHTIWGKLAERLGREPTDQEAIDECKRILMEAA